MKRPTVEEIELFMNEKGCFEADEAELFFCHYDQIDWVVGKSRTPMKKWKSAVGGWLIRNKRRYQNGTRQQSNQTHSQRQHQQAADAYKQMELEHTESDSGAIRPLQ
jgi:hypothetical protein